MNQDLLDFLSGFPRLSPEEVEMIARHIPVKSFSKGYMLLETGKIPSECYYLLKGCIREYKIIDGLEKTTAFYTEKNGTISPVSYVHQTPSAHFLVCMEDCLVISGNREQDKSNYENFPVLKGITANMLESEWIKTKENFTDFITSSPEQRYLNFIEKHGDLFQRVPQHQIASYLGMTPESLSRIRKRVLLKS